MNADNTGIGTGGRFREQWDASQRGSSIMNGFDEHPNGHRDSYANNIGTAAMSSSRPQSFAEGDDALILHQDGGGNRTQDSIRDSVGDGMATTAMSLPERRNTLKKKASLRRSGSLKRSSSRRSMRAGSVRSLALQSNLDPNEIHSVFHCPVPTSGNPTDGLANRFQAWRKIIKDIIAYFRELSAYDEQRIKSLTKLAAAASAMTPPAGFLSSGGLEKGADIIRAYNKAVLADTQRAREVATDVILALAGLRDDLQLKIKEIKSLSGDFKNTVDKEMESTRRAVKVLQEGLGQSDLDPALAVGKQDPYLLRLAVDRQVWRQLEEENYLHQAYLNLERSGRELESIVVGEVQKAYSAYARILKVEADSAYTAIEALRIGPLMMPKDQEWSAFVELDDQFVDPNIPMRSVEHVHYPGQDHPSCQEVRAGLLERKSKYLKSYTAGWYVLSATHLHEFKSADKGQGPVMSLYLPEQKLGSHSAPGSLSNKFVLKGRQTGAMHRGHTWVFRAESYDTMLAWYEDIKALTERGPEDRSAFVRGHIRSMSRSSRRSTSSDGVVDEDDDEPFAANSAVDLSTPQQPQDSARRLQPPGGRFPSDIQFNAQRGLPAPNSPSSVSSGEKEPAPGPGFSVTGQGPPAATMLDLDTLAGSSMLISSTQDARHGQASAAADVVDTDAGQLRDYRLGYGGTDRTPMEEAHSHAALVTQEAREDGVNPYRTVSVLDKPFVPTAQLEAAADASSLVDERNAHSLWQRERSSAGAVSLNTLDSIGAGPLSESAVAVGEVGGHGREPSELDATPQEGLDTSATGQGPAVRPSAGHRSNTGGLSDLHVPGEYPKPSPVP